LRRPEEILIVIHRRGGAGREFLVLQRSPERQGYWHVVAGALEWGESAPAAAIRELREETALEVPVEDLGRTYLYPLDEEPPEVRARFAPGITKITLTAFAAEAPAGWEPVLDEEHVEYRWCSADDALELLEYEEPRSALREVVRLLEAIE
jgi:8-oxo-dGTP pyrophosphatase MutT (NUDIX family)